MANIHRLNDLQNNPQYQQLGQGGAQQLLPFNQITQDPRRDNFLQMLKFSLCPKLHSVSFTVFTCTLISLLYITMLCVNGGPMENPSQYTQFFLYVKEVTLQEFGGNSPYEVKCQGKLYLWISSLFLIANFYYWVMAIVFIMIVYSPIENAFGLKPTIAIYIGGGMCGALFGDVCRCCNQQNIYSEVYSSIYAALGALIGILVLNWKKLDILGPMKMTLMCVLFMVFFIIILFSFSSEQLFYDNYGKLGGLICGSFIAMCTIDVPQPAGQYEQECKKIGLGLLAIFVVLNIILLFSLRY